MGRLKGVLKMNQYDVAGILQSYAERAAKAVSTRQLRRMVKNLKELLDLRSIQMEDEDGD